MSSDNKQEVKSEGEPLVWSGYHSDDPEWQDPNGAVFSQDDLCWKYFENIVPKRDFGVTEDKRVYGGKTFTYLSIVHKGHPKAKFTVITCLAKSRRVLLGLGNWVNNPENANKQGKARDCLKVAINKAEVESELTRWGWDDHLTDGQKRNGPFMRLLEFREECQKWAAWWICNWNKIGKYVGPIIDEYKAEGRKTITDEAASNKRFITRRFRENKIDAETRDREMAEVEATEKTTLAELAKKPVDMDEVAEKYRKQRMHQTYVFHLDKVDPKAEEAKKPRDDGTFAKYRRTEAGSQAADKIPKPDTEFVKFKKCPWRRPFKNEFDAKKPYVPPHEVCQEVWEVEGLVYDPPRFYAIADMGQQRSTPGGAEGVEGEAKEGDEKAVEEQRRKDEADAEHASIVNTFNRPIPDGSIIAIEYGLDIYLDSQGKSGLKDPWRATWFFRGPTDEELKRQQEWRVRSQGATYQGRNLGNMKPVKGAQAYKPTEEYGAVLNNTHDPAALKEAIRTSLAAEKARREAAAKAVPDAKAALAASAAGDETKKDGSASPLSLEHQQGGGGGDDDGMPTAEKLPSYAEANSAKMETDEREPSGHDQEQALDKRIKGKGRQGVKRGRERSD